MVSSGSVGIEPPTDDNCFYIKSSLSGDSTRYDNKSIQWVTGDQTKGGYVFLPTTYIGGELTDANLQTLATKEQIENGNIVAKIAQYASEDTTKGTIEERLTSLGFKTGTVQIADQVSTSVNYLYREGNFVYGRLVITEALNLIFGSVIGFLPLDFLPDSEFSIIINSDRQTGSVNRATFHFYDAALWVDASGKISVSTCLEQSFAYSSTDLYKRATIQLPSSMAASTSSAFYSAIVDFGYRACPIDSQMLYPPAHLMTEWRSLGGGKYNIYLTITNLNPVSVKAYWSVVGLQTDGSATLGANETQQVLLGSADTLQSLDRLDGEIWFVQDGYKTSRTTTFN